MLFSIIFMAAPTPKTGEASDTEAGGTGMDEERRSNLGELEAAVDGVDGYLSDLARLFDDMTAIARQAVDFAVTHGGDPSASNRIGARIDDIKNRSANAFLEAMLYVDDMYDIIDEMQEGDDPDGWEDGEDDPGSDEDTGEGLMLVIPIGIGKGAPGRNPSKDPGEDGREGEGE